MELFYIIVMFVYGTIFGSFYNVVGDRLPNGQSIIKPGSHCPKCNHMLKPLELIPIFSYLIQGGKCKNCKCHIPIIHPIFEFCCGVLFALTYKIYGFNFNFFIAITFISALLIIIVSDINYYIIPDEILVIALIIMSILLIISQGFSVLLSSLFNGLIAFTIMLLIKLMGDYLFKKESMGGGDIKLLFLFGFSLGWEMAILTIFIGSVIGLPISLIILHVKKTNIIPFGPFLSIGAMIIMLSGFDFNRLLDLIS